MEFEYWNLQADAYLNLSLHLYNEDGIMVFDAAPVHEPLRQAHPLPAGLFRDICRVPGDLLNDGMHSVTLLVVQDQGTVLYSQDDILVFDIHDTVEMRGAWYGKWQGVVRPTLDWSTELLEGYILPVAQLTVEDVKLMQ
jgi:lipopolysaccharide transport system ATP-binding protein